MGASNSCRRAYWIGPTLARPSRILFDDVLVRLRRFSAFTLFCWAEGLFREVLQPIEHHVVGDSTFLLSVFSDALAPVKTDPTGGHFSGSVNKLIQFLDRATQRKHLLDHDGLANLVNSQRLQGFVHLALFRIEVEADKIQVLAYFFRIEKRLGIWPGESPGYCADRDQVLAVVLADCGHEFIHPCFGNLLLSAPSKIERQALHEITIA